MSNDAPRSPSGPSVIQALIWGFMAAAFGSLFAFISRLTGEAPALPPAADPLHGTASPAEMNRLVDTLLTSAVAALQHDTVLMSKFGFAILLLCILCLMSTVWIIIRRRRQGCTSVPKWRTVCLIMVLAISPIVLSIGGCSRSDNMLHSAKIVAALRNDNTDPHVVLPGSDVTVHIPTDLQSVNGYGHCTSFDITSIIATLPSGEQVPLKVVDPKSHTSGSIPGNTPSQLVTYLYHVHIPLEFVIPNDPRLAGAVIDMAASGSADIIPSGSRKPTATASFAGKARFRIGREQESSFEADCNNVTSRFAQLNWLTIVSGLFVLIGLTCFGQFACRKCNRVLNMWLEMEGQLCPKCFKEQQKAAEEEQKAAEEKEKAARQAERASASSEPKTTCIVCNAVVLTSTAARTGGKCMPCFKKQ